MTVHHLPTDHPPDVEPPEEDSGARTPPQDIPAEQSVLGAVLLSRDALADVTEVLTGREFYRPAHELIWASVRGLHDAGQPVDAITVHADLARRGEIDRAGGPAYLHTLVAAVPVAANAGYYARIVRERAVLRDLVNAGSRIVEFGYRGASERADVEETVNAAQAEVAAIADGQHGSGGDDSLDAAIEESLDALEHGTAPGLPTGLVDLDRLLNGGLRAGTVTCLAARPAVGKTAVGLDVALNVADAGENVGFTSQEMTRQDLLLRAYANRGGIDYGRLLRAPKEPLSEAEWRKVAQVSGVLRTSGLHIVDRPTASVATIRADIRRMVRRRGSCVLWVIDYLGLLSPPDRRASREQQIAAMMRMIKLTALETGVPILLLAQLNRASAKENRPPRLDDLRDSGTVEQDSDNVILLHRDLEEAPDQMGFLVAKNRRGATGGFVLEFQGHYQRARPKTWSPHAALSAT